MVRPWLMGACILLSVEAPALRHVVYVLMLHFRWRWTLDPRTGVFFWSIKVVLWRFHSLHNHLCCCYTVKITRNVLVLQVPDQSLTNTGGCNYSWDLHTRPLLWTIFVICKRCALLDFSVCFGVCLFTSTWVTMIMHKKMRPDSSIILISSLSMSTGPHIFLSTHDRLGSLFRQHTIQIDWIDILAGGL